MAIAIAAGPESERDIAHLLLSGPGRRQMLLLLLVWCACIVMILGGRAWKFTMASQKKQVTGQT
jgi:hypothetical protein